MLITFILLFADLNSYLEDCMKSLLNGDKPPTCYVRLDRSHFVKSLFRHKELHNIDKRKAKLFRQIFGFLIQCDSIKQMEVIATQLFTITSCEYVDDQVSTALTNLKQLVETHIFESTLYPDSDEIDKDFTDQVSSNSDSDSSYKGTLNYKWINNIYQSVCNAAESKNVKPKKKKDVENLYYAPNLKQYFLRLFVRAPLWSNIMCPRFKSLNKSPTSSGSESNFKNIKHLLNRPYRVDKFVKFHLEHLSGYMMQEIAEHNESSTKPLKSLKPSESSIQFKTGRTKNKIDFDYNEYSNTDEGSDIKRHNSEPDLYSSFDDSIDHVKKCLSQPDLSNSSISYSNDSNIQNKANTTDEYVIEKPTTMNRDSDSSFDNSIGENRTKKRRLQSDSSPTLSNSSGQSSIPNQFAEKMDSLGTISVFDETKSDRDDADPCENWKNKNKKETGLFSKNRRSNFSILNPQQNVDGNVPILKNGHSSTNKSIVTRHTCGFDAIYSAYAVVYTDYHLHEQNTSNLFFEFIERTNKYTKCMSKNI